MSGVTGGLGPIHALDFSHDLMAACALPLLLLLGRQLSLVSPAPYLRGGWSDWQTLEMSPTVHSFSYDLVLGF